MTNKTEYVKFNFKLDVNIDELLYYCYWCDGKQFRKDIFDEERFTKDYVSGKFRDFQDRFPQWLASLDDTHKSRFAEAVHKFFENNHKEE